MVQIHVGQPIGASSATEDTGIPIPLTLASSLRPEPLNQLQIGLGPGIA